MKPAKSNHEVVDAQAGELLDGTDGARRGRPDVAGVPADGEGGVEHAAVCLGDGPVREGARGDVHEGVARDGDHLDAAAVRGDVDEHRGVGPHAHHLARRARAVDVGLTLAGVRAEHEKVQRAARGRVHGPGLLLGFAAQQGGDVLALDVALDVAVRQRHPRTPEQQEAECRECGDTAAAPAPAGMPGRRRACTVRVARTTGMPRTHAPDPTEATPPRSSPVGAGWVTGSSSARRMATARTGVGRRNGGGAGRRGADAGRGGGAGRPGEGARRVARPGPRGRAEPLVSGA